MPSRRPLASRQQRSLDARHPKLGALQALAQLLTLDVAADEDKRGALSFIMTLAER